MAGAGWLLVSASQRRGVQARRVPSSARRTSASRTLGGLRTIGARRTPTDRPDVANAPGFRAALDLLDIEVCSIYLRDEGSGRFYFVANEGLNPDLLGKVVLAAPAFAPCGGKTRPADHI